MPDPRLRRVKDVHVNLPISCPYLTQEQKIHFLSIYIKRELMKKYDEKKIIIDKAIDEVPGELFDVFRMPQTELENQSSARLLIEAISLRLYLNGVEDISNDDIYDAIYKFSEKYTR
jgi:hypothetical protein